MLSRARQIKSNQIKSNQIKIKIKSKNRLKSNQIKSGGPWTAPVPDRLISIKGTGEASPVRGRDWAGFKFAAK